METSSSEHFPEIAALYVDLSPLDKNREVYLLTTIFGQEMGLSSSWDYQQDVVRWEYARSVGEYVNKSIATEVASGDCSSETVEDIIVHHLIAETQHRWLTYTERIVSTDKVESFTEKIATETAVTCSLEEKAQQIRQSWRKYIEDYGQAGAAFNASVRAEFVQNKTIWDTAKESKFLSSVLASDEQEVAA